jgi:excisionase family DNA binding protein
MELLTVREAAKYLKMSFDTMNRWRVQRRGPDYVKMGKKVVYAKEALDQFIKKNTVKTKV